MRRMSGKSPRPTAGEVMSEQYEDQNPESSGLDQSEGGGGEGGGEENNEADMIFAPEASKPGRNAGMLMVAFVLIGVGVIYFMRTRGGPSIATANPDVTKENGRASCRERVENSVGAGSFKKKNRK